MSEPIIVVEGSFRAPDLAAALPHMIRMIAASRAEPGCIEYAYALDVLDATLVRVLAGAAHHGPQPQAVRGRAGAVLRLSTGRHGNRVCNRRSSLVV